jgi:hypothetical protein
VQLQSEHTVFDECYFPGNKPKAMRNVLGLCYQLLLIVKPPVVRDGSPHLLLSQNQHAVLGWRNLRT